MSREKFESMKVNELKKLATSKGIKGAWNLKKAEVIDKLLEKELENEVVQKTDEVPEYNKERKMESYIEKAEVGMLVAFKLKNGKVKSAKIAKKSTIDRKFLLETEYKQSYVVDFDDILWVRTGTRWPKGIYRLLKGLVDSDEQK